MGTVLHENPPALRAAPFRRLIPPFEKGGQGGISSLDIEKCANVMWFDFVNQEGGLWL
jgi:hypothetical protein